MKRILWIFLFIFTELTLIEVGFHSYYFIQNRILTSQNDKNRFEIYVTGESTTAGYPYSLNSQISFPTIVAKMFKNNVLGKPITLHSLAVPGQSIYPQAFLLNQKIRYRDKSVPGVVFIYSGQNEGFLDDAIKTPPLQKFREKIAAHSLLLSTLFYHAEKRSLLPRVRTMETYEFYLRQTIETSLKNGLTPMIATVASNIADIEPGLIWTGRLSRTDTVELITQGERLESQNRYLEAIAYDLKVIRENPEMATYMNFRIGKCYERLKQDSEARQYYWSAIDSNRFDNFSRATDAQNTLIRNLAKEYHIPLIDTVRLFETHAAHGLLGNDLFIDGQHPNEKGYLLLADGFAQALAALTGESVTLRISTKEQLFQLFSYSRMQQVNPLLASGKWLFIMSMRHIYPKWRLALARQCYVNALTLDPHHFSAWLLLGFVDAAEHRDILLDETALSWLEKNSLFGYYNLEYRLTQDQLQDMITHLQSWDVSPIIINKILSTYPQSLSL